jgi:hypothetical protein
MDDGTMKASPGIAWSSLYLHTLHAHVLLGKEFLNNYWLGL